MAKLNLDHLEFIIGEMKREKINNPKASILFDTNKNLILINYPLPEDFKQTLTLEVVKNKI